MSPSSHNDIIEQYFNDPITQTNIAEVEKIRLEAYNKKWNYYKKYGAVVVGIYILIGLGWYHFFESIEQNENVFKFCFGTTFIPGIIFIAEGQSKQTSLLESKKVVTTIFNNFIKFIFPSAQFSETKDLYKGDPMDSELFIDDQAKNTLFETISIDKNICNSLCIPLLYTIDKQVSVMLEGVEAQVIQTKGSGKGKITTEDMGMLYKIIFTNPKRTIKQSVKVIQNNNSRFKKRQHRVNLENQQFEEYFDVYSEDDIEARMILTPNVMDKLAELSQSTGSKYSFNFINNIFYIKNTLSDDNGGIDLTYTGLSGKSHSMIDIDRDKGLEDKKDIYRRFYTEMINIQTLVDALNVDYFNKLS